jgi:hypothetical protein
MSRQSQPEKAVEDGGELFVFDPRFAEAFLNEENHRVFGRTLKPLSLWHQLQLEYVNSPFLTGASIGLIDLEIASRICETVFPRKVVVPNMKGWRKWLWLLRHIRRNLQREVLLFEAYYIDFASTPKYWPQDGAPRDRQIDELLELVWYLCRRCGWKPEYVWNLPLGQAHWYQSTDAVVFENAECLIWTPIDEEAFQAHKAKKAARLQARIDELVKSGMSHDAAKAQAVAEQRDETAKRMAQIQELKSSPQANA